MNKFDKTNNSLSINTYFLRFISHLRKYKKYGNNKKSLKNYKHSSIEEHLFPLFLCFLANLKYYYLIFSFFLMEIASFIFKTKAIEMQRIPSRRQGIGMSINILKLQQKHQSFGLQKKLPPQYQSNINYLIAIFSKEITLKIKASVFKINLLVIKMQNITFLSTIFLYLYVFPVITLQISYGIIWNIQSFKRIIIKIMKNLAIPNPHPSIFQSITPQVTELIKNDSICLQSAFFLNRENGPQINVSLTNLHMAIFVPRQTHPEYLFHAELTFDLKFEAIYELDGRCSAEEAVFSKPIGFKIIKEGGDKIELFAKCKSLTSIWIKHLSRHLNQYGFHRIYKLVKKIGKGGFANVYEVQRVTDKEHFAVKAFTKQSTLFSSDIQNKLNLLNEIQMLRTFDSPHILKCEGVFQSQNSIYIILELLPHGQLYKRINEKEAKFSPSQIKEFIKGMALGLMEMHNYRIMHRDIKPENIMMRGTEGLSPVIADFGLAADADSDDYIFYRCGTPGYVAPEVTTLIKGGHIEPQCDIFSLGTILHILLVQKQLFKGRKTNQVYENNKKMQFNLYSQLYKDVDSEALDLLRRMLKIDPKERIKASQILIHPYIAGHSAEIDSQKSISSPASTVPSSKIINFTEVEQTF